MEVQGELFDASNMLEAGSRPDPSVIHDCGWPEGSFACKIRHINMNSGAAKAARD